MLAALLCNLGAAPIRKKPVYDPELADKFLYFRGRMHDVQADQPEKRIVKKVLATLEEIELAPEHEKIFAQIKPQLTDFSLSVNLHRQAQQLEAYFKAIEILKKAMQEAEEEELILLLISI